MTKKRGRKTKYEIRDNSETYTYHDVNKAHPVLSDMLSYGLFKVAVRHRLNLDKALNEVGLGLQSLHFSILYVIGSGRFSQNEICEQFGVDKASMVKIIDRLEDAKVIERRPSQNDRRVNYLYMTAKGEKFSSRAREIVKETEKETLSIFSQSEGKAFRTLIKRLLTR